MLSELHIRNFAIIDDLRVQFAFGFNVLTGETGAGKSILLDSVGLLLGDRADSTMVRSGCETAILEATFELTPPVQAMLLPHLLEQGLEGDDADVLWVAREIRSNGRNVCRINGRIVSLTTLREIGDYLVDIHGQGDHLTLLNPRSHLPLLDAHGNLEADRRVVERQVAELRELRRELAELRAEVETTSQRMDFLQFQADEIAAARLVEGEEEELRAERSRLANAEQLIHDAAEVIALLEGGAEDAPAILDLLGQVEKTLIHLSRLDTEQSATLEKVQGLFYQLSEVVGEMRDYQDTLEFNPDRLSEVEERIDLLNRLKRKYGPDIPAILAAHDKAVAELDNISLSEERIDRLSNREQKLLVEIGESALSLSHKRRQTAEQLSQSVEQELAQLRMPGARFKVEMRTEADDRGAVVGEERLAFATSGIDQVEFLISTNPGEPLKPMARVASGGETSRLMLALKSALAQVDATPTLIFDEIDQGIGGRIGNIVGRKLWGLTRHGGHQVIVVTHLPQMAGYGDIHLQVSKDLAGERTVTTVTPLDESGRIAELAAMLGTSELEARNGAEAILRQVAETKRAALVG